MEYIKGELRTAVYELEKRIEELERLLKYVYKCGCRDCYMGIACPVAEEIEQLAPKKEG